MNSLAVNYVTYKNIFGEFESRFVLIEDAQDFIIEMAVQGNSDIQIAYDKTPFAEMKYLGKGKD